MYICYIVSRNGSGFDMSAGVRLRLMEQTSNVVATTSKQMLCRTPRGKFVCLQERAYVQQYMRVS